MKNTVTEATPKDGPAMLALIESAASRGSIELIYTRRPDAYWSYQQEGKSAAIGLIKDAEGQIVAQAACTLRDYWINGEKRTLGYVSGVRKRADYKGWINWKAVSDFILESRCDLFYCSFLSDNPSALGLFTKKRAFIPTLHKLCEYTTYILNPRAIRAPKNLNGDVMEGLRFRPMTASDLPRVIAFLNREGQAYQFAPVVEDLFKEFSGLSESDCYVLEKDGEFAAFGALWDQTAYRQYIVTRYQGQMTFFKKFSRITEKLGYIPIPKENVPLVFPTLTLFYAKDNQRAYYDYFLYRVAMAVRARYSMFVVGMCSGDPNREVFEALKSIRIRSELYYVYHDEEILLSPEMPVRLECGLL